MKSLSVIKSALTLFILIIRMQALQAQTDVMASDSLRDKNQIDKPGVMQVLFNGVLIPDETKERTWYIAPLFDVFQYNTVEGFVFNPKVSITQQLKEDRFYAIKPNLRYGFGSKKPYGKLSATYYYNPAKLGSLEISGGTFVAQFDDRSTLTPFANSYSTLLAKENFLRIYASNFIELKHRFSPLKNVLLSNQLNWSSRRSLNNLDRFNEEDYASNIPANDEVLGTPFEQHQVFYQQTEIRWQPNLSYEYLRGKWVPTSKYPAIVLKYKSAHSNVFGSDLRYQNIALGVEGNIKVGTLGEGNFNLEVGDFLSRDSLSFVDFTHFQGNRTTYTTYEEGTFQLLDYYSLSTAGAYFRSHYTHTFQAIKNRFIPMIEGNYLRASDSNYVELGVGMQRTSKPFRISFYNSWLDGNHDRAEVRVGFIF